MYSSVKLVHLVGSFDVDDWATARVFVQEFFDGTFSVGYDPVAGRGKFTYKYPPEAIKKLDELLAKGEEMIKDLKNQ